MALPRHCKHRRPVVEERKWCDHASGRKAARADAESGRRRGGDPNEPVTSKVDVGCCGADRVSKLQEEGN